MIRPDDRSAPIGLLALALLTLTVAPPRPAGALDGTGLPEPPPLDGERLYRANCAACHGVDGTGSPPSRVGFHEELPDFTDCSFATREPDSDWVGVAHDGGPARAFSPMMPALGGALTMDELQAVMDHVRGFCDNRTWPRGELNLPRAMFTEKAFVEDEAVLTTGVMLQETAAVEHEIVYEKRIGSFSQLEVVVPFGWGQREVVETGDEEGWTGGLGDVALGFKTAPLHSFRSGTIAAVAAEIILPTGSQDAGYTKGTAVFEPFVSFGQDLRAVGFLQAQAGFEIPFLTEVAEPEAFWRAAYGRTITEGPFGRAWTPMVEVLGKRDLEDDAKTHWDIVPQLQVTLNQRQHIMICVAGRIPLESTDTRNPEILLYLLWDWFDGGFFEGW